MTNIDDVVENEVNKWKTNNSFAIAKERGIQLCYENLGNILGYYNSYKRIQMIHIRFMINEESKRYVCGHELGHAILHPKSNTSFLKKHTLFSIEKIEMEANEFVTKLLTYDCEIDEGMTKETICKICGIPPEMARFI